jgi:UDP-galactopyranose mutase
MLSGVVKPELGGHPRYLDIIGVNYYHANQWEYPDDRLRWEHTPRDERWIPFSVLVADVHRRYRRPMFVAETDTSISVGLLRPGKLLPRLCLLEHPAFR